MCLFIVVDLQSWEKKIAEEKEQEYDNEEDIEIEEKITVSHFLYIIYYILCCNFPILFHFTCSIFK